jgi:hypothetical protein
MFMKKKEKKNCLPNICKALGFIHGTNMKKGWENKVLQSLWKSARRFLKI